MAFDGTKPNISQTMGDVIAAANQNDVDLDARIEAHKSDQGNPHGIQTLKNSAADYMAHKTDSAAHGIDKIQAAQVATQAEVTAGRGASSSLAARLQVALNADGSIRLSTLNNKWINNGDIPTFISTTSFSVPGDKTLMYIGGAILRFSVAGNYAYAPVASRSYGGGVTTVVIDPGYPILSAGIQSVDLALIAFDNSIANAVTQNAAALTALTGVVAGMKVIDIENFSIGKPAANQVMNRYIAPRAYTLPAGAVNSQFKSLTAATGVSTFMLQKNGANVGTVSFAAAATVGVFNIAAAVAFAPGDVLAIIAPAAQDATLSDLIYTLQGVLS